MIQILLSPRACRYYLFCAPVLNFPLGIYEGAVDVLEIRSRKMLAIYFGAVIVSGFI